MGRVVVIGGYGSFGRRAVERLARNPDLGIVVAGRRLAEAERTAHDFLAMGKAQVSAAMLDSSSTTAADLRYLNASVVINASGPFQTQDYTLARACIGAGCHYVDLADAPSFVTGISALDADAKAAGVLVVSGASSVPGLSSAVVASYAEAFDEFQSIDIGICPGNRFDPGAATTASVLSGLGRSIATRINGSDATVYGWQGLSRHRFGSLGSRWLGHVDVPDLMLFPQTYPTLKTIRFRAGVEVTAFHFGLYALSWVVRSGLLRRPESLAPLLLAAKRKLSFLGSDNGGIFVRMAGRSTTGAPKTIEWSLVARKAHGPYVPVTGAVILAQKLIEGTEHRRGAMPCFGLFTLYEFAGATEDLAFEFERSP